jgi:hypothetical protein
MLATHSPRDIAALVSMPQVLRALGFEANERTRRCACILHGGSNRSAFSWTETGLWKCHSCGAGGDRVSLVRAVRSCGFREALEFLGHLASVEYSPRLVSCRDIERARISHERAEKAAWRVRDEIVRLRAYYRDGLHRSERLWGWIGDELCCRCDEQEREAIWDRMARLASVSTFFLAAYNYIYAADSRELIQFALGSSEERRILIFGGLDAASVLQVA